MFSQHALLTNGPLRPCVSLHALVPVPLRFFILPCLSIASSLLSDPQLRHPIKVIDLLKDKRWMKRSVSFEPACSVSDRY